MARNHCCQIGAQALRRGFSLVELLVVLVIITIIISITVPAVSSARQSARGVATRQQITGIVTAVGSFQNDKRTLPGYFSARDMGQPDNATEGFTGIENLLLDLAGQAAIVDGPGTDVIQVGPSSTAAQKVYVKPDLIGSSDGANRSYLTLDKKSLVTMDPTQDQQVTTQARMPELVDAWGTPLMIWTVDEGALGERIRDLPDFAKENSGTSGAPRRGLVYWNQNAGYLKARALGQLRQNQASNSFLGASGTPAQAQVNSLAGALGSPAYPVRDTAAPATSPPRVASRARGSIMIQSAGRDGIFLANQAASDTRASRDGGYKQFSTPTIDYRINFVRTETGSLPADQHVDKDNKPTTIDLLEKFDDLMGGAGN